MQACEKWVCLLLRAGPEARLASLAPGPGRHNGPLQLTSSTHMQQLTSLPDPLADPRPSCTRSSHRTSTTRLARAPSRWTVPSWPWPLAWPPWPPSLPGWPASSASSEKLEARAVRGLGLGRGRTGRGWQGVYRWWGGVRIVGPVVLIGILYVGTCGISRARNMAGTWRALYGLPSVLRHQLCAAMWVHHPHLQPVGLTHGANSLLRAWAAVLWGHLGVPSGLAQGSAATVALALPRWSLCSNAMCGACGVLRITATGAPGVHALCGCCP